MIYPIGVFEKGHQHLPEEPYFPFAIASTASMEYQDYARAAHWMKIASETPDAPPWYRASYAGFLEETTNREVSLNYLKQQIDVQTNQTIRDYLTNKYRRVLHEMYQDKIRELRKSIYNDISSRYIRSLRVESSNRRSF